MSKQNITSLVTIDELRTLLVEIEGRVINRPLTYMSDTPNEPEPRTLNPLQRGSITEPIPSNVRKEQIKDSDYTFKSETNLKEVKTRFNQINKLLKNGMQPGIKITPTSLGEHYYGRSSNVTFCKLKVGDNI